MVRNDFSERKECGEVRTDKILERRVWARLTDENNVSDSEIFGAWSGRGWGFEVIESEEVDLTTS